jgi:ABC-type uncharacterized transport system substrate-binding protein
MSFGIRLAAVLVLVSVVLVVVPLRAQAHPHVWIDAFVEVVVDQGRVTSLRINWTFDPFFTGMASADFDADGNAELDQEEAAKLAANSAENLKDVGFFTHVWLNADPLDIAAAEDFSAWIEDGRLNFAFTVAMPEPIDPTQTILSISLYDPSYYIEVTLDPVDPLRFSGGEAPCLANVQPDPQRTIYYGLVRPDLMQLLCNTS